MAGEEMFQMREATGNRHLVPIITVYVAFCLLSAVSRLSEAGFSLMVIAGILFPLACGKRTGRWAEMGFTRRNLRCAVLWGLAGGAAMALVGSTVVQVRWFPPDLGLQLAVGGPLWLLLASPFQEFFFRGWLQGRLEGALGRTWGLLAASALFVLWHYAPDFVSNPRMSFPLATLSGLAATALAALVLGYVFQRTRSIVAPWLAHAVFGVAFIVMGVGGFVVTTP
jgi:membrane protease YdiL (CAAX protease family)